MFFLPIIIFAVFFITFIIIGMTAMRGHKHTEDTMRNMINTVSAYAENKMNSDINKLNEQPKVCEYCGSQIPANNKKCNSCGAQIKK